MAIGANPVSGLRFVATEVITAFMTLEPQKPPLPPQDAESVRASAVPTPAIATADPRAAPVSFAVCALAVAAFSLSLFSLFLFPFLEGLDVFLSVAVIALVAE